jgi:solute carrier family 27 fatty acid transporter 1/4
VERLKDSSCIFEKDKSEKAYFIFLGENCSTAEVESVISNVCGLRDVVAYGVEIPGNEGRAGT